MSPFDYRSPLDRLTSVCWRLLGGAVAVYMAVKLVLLVAWPLLIIIGVVAVVAGGIVFMRFRSRGW